MPIGLCLYDEDLEAEKHHYHFGIFDQSGEVLACVVATPLSSTQAKIRQMAVHPSCRSKEYGSRLLREFESWLETREFNHLVLHARMSSSDFYKKQSYRETGPEFLEVGIQHVRMEKKSNYKAGLAVKMIVHPQFALQERRKLVKIIFSDNGSGLPKQE